MNQTLSQIDVRSKIFNKLAHQFWLADLVSFGFIRYWRKYGYKLLDVKKGMTICDAMCGQGHLWPSLLDSLGHKGKVMAVDLSAEMLLEATKRKSEQVIVLNEDFLQNSIPAQSIDRVICTFGIKTLQEEELSGFMRQLARILKPGGKFVLVELHVPTNSIVDFCWRAYMGFVCMLVALVTGEIYNLIYYLACYTDTFSSNHHLKNTFLTSCFKTKVSRHCLGSILVIRGQKQVIEV